MEWQAKIRFVDVRVITITAETEAEAQMRFESGYWDDETTVEFYSDEVLSDLAPSPQDATP